MDIDSEAENNDPSATTERVGPNKLPSSALESSDLLSAALDITEAALGDAAANDTHDDFFDSLGILSHGLESEHG